MRPVKLAPGAIVVELSMHDAMALINALSEHADGLDNGDAPLCEALAAALVGYAILAEGRDDFEEGREDEGNGMRALWRKWATHDTYAEPWRKFAPPHWLPDVAVEWENTPKEVPR